MLQQSDLGDDDGDVQSRHHAERLKESGLQERKYEHFQGHETSLTRLKW